jgi:hypothetical protein
MKSSVALRSASAVVIALCLYATTAVEEVATAAPARAARLSRAGAQARMATTESTSATLSAAFTPEQLGGRTTLHFGFAFSAPPGQVPPPLTQIELRYPNNLGIALSGLGLATCSATALSELGPKGCPPNSIMGRGEAYTGIVLGVTPIRENAPIWIVRAPNQEGHLSVLFYSEGSTPVDTHIEFPGILLPSDSPFGGVVSIGIPLVPTLPGAPYISVIHLHATLGPIGVTYYEHFGGVTLAYTPKGILLPKTCPRGGFPFAATFSFLDGSEARGSTAIPCPDPPKKRKKRH